jgi:hypothetical protein
MDNVRLAVRNRGNNYNHHLWNNNGTWFVHYTIHPTPITKQRIRCSLGIKSLAEARRRRDELFERLVNKEDNKVEPAEVVLAA